MDESLFPARRSWPAAISDISQIPVNASSVRLVSKSTHFKNIADYKSLKLLWCFDIDEHKLRFISSCTSLEYLYIDHLKTGNLNSLENLPNLKTLGIERCSKIHSLEFLREFTSLTGLAIVHFKNVDDLTPLSELKSLRMLAVEGSMWTRMRVQSFSPLGCLENLEFLSLGNTKALDESLKPLENLRNLRDLHLANFYPMQEFARLSQKLTNTKCNWLQPYSNVECFTCKKCQSNTMVMLTGKRKPLLCTQCDRKALPKHVEEWNDFIK